MKTETITITIDGKAVECQPGELLIEVAKRANIYIPYFCYHPRMDPVGACRMCLVHIEPGPPKPQTSCTTRVSDGMTVRTQFSDPGVQEAQQSMLEFLLINHPLDCPICDRAGECPLQDQTQDYGPNESVFIEPKRRLNKALPISPLVTLDQERCILCYRCTRFCDEISGDTLISAMERGPRAYIAPFADDEFDSYFSGNTVQICPVGALTSSEYRFKARPWDLETVGSTCNMCAAGCSLDVNVRVQDGNVVRFAGATNEETNEEWLCDKGRYGNAYISSPDRLTQPMARRDADLEPVSWSDAFRFLHERLQPVFDKGRGSAAGMITGGSLCDEDSYAAQKFARVVLGTNAVDHRLEGGVSSDVVLTPQFTYDDLLSSDLVVLVALDAREELPLVYLRLRVAATKRDLPIAIVHPRAVGLTEVASGHLAPLPGTEAATGRALAAALEGSADGDAAAVAGLAPDDVRRFADLLRAAERPVIVVGPRVGHDHQAVRAWGGVAGASGGRVGWVPRRAGENGAIAAGAHPGLLPGYRPVTDDAARAEVSAAWGVTLPSEPGPGVASMLKGAADGKLSALWLVGADVINDVPSPRLGEQALATAQFVVVQDIQRSELLSHADLVLPAAAFGERAGTLTDWEGRRQPVSAATDPPGSARADYAILAEAARRLDRPIGCLSADDTRAELEGLIGGRGAPPFAFGDPVAREGAEGYPLRLETYRLLYDAGSRVSKTRGIADLTQPATVEVHPADAERASITDGQQVRVSSGHGSVLLPAVVTDRIRPGAVFIPTNQPGTPARQLRSPADLFPNVKVEPA